MYLILFVLHDINLCEEVLEAWEEAGIRGVTILPSTGLARFREAALREDLPLFPSLGNIFKQSENLNRTFFTVVDNDRTVDKLVKATENVIGDLCQPNTGILIVLPVARVYGLQSSNNHSRSEDDQPSDG